jgi:hypothetical protein
MWEGTDTDKPCNRVAVYDKCLSRREGYTLVQIPADEHQLENALVYT